MLLTLGSILIIIIMSGNEELGSVMQWLSRNDELGPCNISKNSLRSSSQEELYRKVIIILTNMNNLKYYYYYYYYYQISFSKNCLKSC